MSKITIKKSGGKWLINGKPYEKLEPHEKIFFDDFIRYMRENYLKSE